MLFFKSKRTLIERIKQLEKENDSLQRTNRVTTDKLITQYDRCQYAEKCEFEIKRKYIDLLDEHTDTLEKMSKYQKAINTNELERLQEVVKCLPMLNDDKIEIKNIDFEKHFEPARLETIYFVKIKAKEHLF